jgi:two-component system OmpR family sensor kinase
VNGQIRVVMPPNVNASGGGAPTVTVDQAMAAVRDGNAFTVSSTSGSGRYRVLSMRAPGGINVVGISLQDVDSTMSRLHWVLFAAIAIVIGILGVVVFWVLRLGVRPIKRMTKTAGAIAAGDLSQRVPAEAEGTEARELGDALNGMLTTIEGAFAERAASEARLRRFVADASHELRTPVTTIRGYAELYRHGGLSEPDDLDQAMRRTEQESVRMASLVDDLLLLARLDEGRPLARDPVDLGVLGIDAAADARAVAPDRVVTADVAEGVTVDGDEDRLRQVVGNLVGNARKFTDAGHIEVRASRDPDGDGIRITVADTGCGIGDDHLPFIFDLYRQVPNGRAHDGCGIGLYIVRRYVEMLGGRVSCASAPGQGTTFTIRLPRSSEAMNAGSGERPGARRPFRPGRPPLHVVGA